MYVAPSSPQPSTSPSAWQQRVLVSGTLAAITSLALVILAGSAVPIGVVGYAPVVLVDVFFLVVFALSCCQKQKASLQLQYQRQIAAEDERPFIPNTMQVSEPFRRARELGTAMRPHFSLTKNILIAALRNYHRDDTKEFPGIREGMDILAEEISSIFERDPQRLFLLILHFQAASQYNRATMKNLLDENRSNSGFFRRFHEAFDGSLRRPLEEVVQTHLFDQDRELNRMIGNLRRYSQRLESIRGRYEGRDITDDSWALFWYFVRYVKTKGEYESTLGEIVIHLLKNQWERQFGDRFYSLAPRANMNAFITFFTNIQPRLTEFSEDSNAEQRIGQLYNDIACSQNRGDMDRIIGNLAGDIFPGMLGDALQWTGDLVDVLFNNSSVDSQALIAQLESVKEAYEESGILNRQGIQTLLSWIPNRWIPKGWKESAVKQGVNKYIDSLPFTVRQKSEIKRAFALIIPELLEPLYHGTLNQDHPFRTRVQNFTTQISRYAIYRLGHQNLPENQQAQN
ncbi:MAG: hypothetical protein WAM28_04625 [Chlamydiales bacterium]